MNEYKFDVPVLLLIFNRPETTFRVFQKIKECRPARLFVAADGRREDVPGDEEKCLRAREIVDQIDWDCEVKTLFRERNLGCKAALSSAINWFFQNVEEGIILEDDCLPDLSFFKFCKELLRYYRDDKRIMMISGDNIQFGDESTDHSYYFSKYSYIWGWASWRRAWNSYDVDMKLWPRVRDEKLFFDIFDSKKEFSYWRNIFDKVYKGKINTWDYQWLFSCWSQKGLTIIPRVNLVSNIGFGNDGAHYKRKGMLANLERKKVVFPLSHPPHVTRNVIADKADDRSIFSSCPLHKKISDKIHSLLDSLLGR